MQTVCRANSIRRRYMCWSTDNNEIATIAWWPVLRSPPHGISHCMSTTTHSLGSPTLINHSLISFDFSERTERFPIRYPPNEPLDNVQWGGAIRYCLVFRFVSNINRNTNLPAPPAQISENIAQLRVRNRYVDIHVYTYTHVHLIFVPPKYRTQFTADVTPYIVYFLRTNSSWISIH